MTTTNQTDLEWQNVGEAAPFSESADWKLQLQEHKADPTRVRVQAVDGKAVDSFTCEAYDGSYLLESEAGNFRPDRLPKGLVVTTQDLSKAARIERCGQSKTEHGQVLDLEDIAVESARLKTGDKVQGQGHAGKILAERARASVAREGFNQGHS